PDAVELDEMALADDLAPARDHVRAGYGICGAVDDGERTARALQCRDPSLAMRAAVGHVVDELVREKMAGVVRDEGPDGVELTDARLRRRSEDRRHRA